MSTRTHDFGLSWRDYTFKPIDNGMKGRVSGWGAHPKNGDYLLLKQPGNADGRTRYRIDEIKYYANPKDMWSADVSFAPR